MPSTSTHAAITSSHVKSPLLSASIRLNCLPICAIVSPPKNFAIASRFADSDLPHSFLSTVPLPFLSSLSNSTRSSAYAPVGAAAAAAAAAGAGADDAGCAGCACCSLSFSFSSFRLAFVSSLLLSAGCACCSLSFSFSSFRLVLLAFSASSFTFLSLASALAKDLSI